MSKSTLQEFLVKLIHETDKAWLITDGGKNIWFSKSWGELEPTDKPGYYILTTEENKAIEKGLL